MNLNLLFLEVETIGPGTSSSSRLFSICKPNRCPGKVIHWERLRPLVGSKREPIRRSSLGDKIIYIAHVMKSHWTHHSVMWDIGFEDMRWEKFFEFFLEKINLWESLLYRENSEFGFKKGHFFLLQFLLFFLM